MTPWKKPLLATAAVLALSVAAVPARADGLDTFLRSVNVQAQANLGGFPAAISAQFGVPVTQVSVITRQVRQPGDVFMIYQLSQWSGRPPLEVYDHYRRERGWGRLAQNLGIKPGSAQFQALKRGELRYVGLGSRHEVSPGSRGYDRKREHGHDDDKGRGWEHGRGHGHGNGRDH
ncbi:hypothetical protein [Amphibiibacter pelophylacis]|uniref:Uncharacterized protein n=1 Tax=Amphibiibacter pelophylacis TaxID=1799477 RepID=A0ACC6P3I3_9BURK